MTISVLSKHVLPMKGYQTHVEKFKAFSTVIGGVIYMLVSYTHDFISKTACYFLYFQFIGTSYITPAVVPYFASYYGVSDQSVAVFMPAILGLNCAVLPLGGYLTSKLHPNM